MKDFKDLLNDNNAEDTNCYLVKNEKSKETECFQVITNKQILKGK
jgi:hypothetical protein